MGIIKYFTLTDKGFALLDRLERIAKNANCQPVLDEIAFERKFIERKLYQKPPLTSNEE